MGGSISKNLRWDGSVVIEPHTFDLLKFFAPREGLRVSAMFAELLPWVVYTHDTACGRVCADCFDLRRAIRETRLRKELPTARRFRLFEGMCLVAALIGEQFTGKEGWLSVDGSLNVFLLDIGGQVLAVSVSCLDDSGEFFVDDWWLLVDRAGPLRARDRVFSYNPSKSLPRTLPACPPTGDFLAYAPANRALVTVPVERRSVGRGYYRAYGLGGHALEVYLHRHTVKRFCHGFTAQSHRLAAKKTPAGRSADYWTGDSKKDRDNPSSLQMVRYQNPGMLQGR
ncbi:MAG: hypothetical protein ACOYMG_05240 [Candidatus Methylumidiphilus sp.]